MLGINKAKESPMSSVRSGAKYVTEKIIPKSHSNLVENFLPNLPGTMDKVKS